MQVLMCSKGGHCVRRAVRPWGLSTSELHQSAQGRAASRPRSVQRWRSTRRCGRRCAGTASRRWSARTGSRTGWRPPPRTTDNSHWDGGVLREDFRKGKPDLVEQPVSLAFLNELLNQLHVLAR